MMNVIYDISVLGAGYYNPVARTGVFRVIENLAQELVHEQILCSFSSGIKLEDYFQCIDYLRSNKYLENIPLAIPNVNQNTLRIFKYLYEWKHSKTKINIPVRIINKIANYLAANTLESHIINPQKLALADIYHSPLNPVPEQVKKIKHLKNFITIYDLISVFHPHFFQSNQNILLEQILKSIDENVWVMCISQATRNDLCNHLPSLDPSRVFVTHLAASDLFYPCRDQIKMAAIKTRFAIPEGSYILSLSTLEPRKNIAQTIKCFARLVEEQAVTDLSLVLVGTKGWDFDAIFNEISANPKIRDRVIVTGYVPDEDLAALYSGAIMFVYPSFYEGFGLPPLEAMQCGTPVITSNTSSLPEVVGNAGIMVSPEDGDTLCQAMLDIYNSGKLRQKMSANSLIQAQQFSWKKCAEQTIDAYNTAFSR